MLRSDDAATAKEWLFNNVIQSNQKRPLTPVSFCSTYDEPRREWNVSAVIVEKKLKVWDHKIMFRSTFLRYNLWQSFDPHLTEEVFFDAFIIVQPNCFQVIEASKRVAMQRFDFVAV